MTVSLKLSEPIIEAVRQKLRDNMPARVATINADPNLPEMQPQLKAPVTEAYYTAPKNPMPPAMPAVVVVDGDMGLDPGSEGPHSFIGDTAVGVMVLDEHADREILVKRLQRLTRAAIESLWDSEPQERLILADGSGSAFRIFPTRVTPGPMAVDPDRPDITRSFYVIVMSVRHLEE